MSHQMKLNDLPFSLIRDGKQIVEARLCDDKRQKISVGDVIEFKQLNGDETFETKVVELMKFDTFCELFSSAPTHEFGGTDVDELTEAVFKYYSKEDEEKYGVLGIRLEV